MTDDRHDDSPFDRLEKTDQVRHLSARQIPEEGNVIAGRYEVQRQLDEYRLIVKHLGVQQDFLMRMAPTLAPGSRAEERLKTVAQSAGLLGHESLGFITDFGFSEAFGAYIVSQYVEGTSLQTLIDEGEQLSLEDVLEFALQIGGALAAIHEVGIAHGLFAPIDLIKTSHGRWKLLGAGIASSPQFGDEFQPPEVERYRDITAKSDQFTFASFLYQLLVGAPPEGEDPFEPSALRADVPLDVDTSIMKARSKDPDERFETMDELLEALHQAFAEWHEPSMSPFDAREASRLIALHPDMESENEFARTDTKKSVVVSIEKLADASSKLDVQFASAARLRREYRRNIVARGLFVPMLHPLEAEEQSIRVCLEYAPTGQSVEVDATVASSEPGSEEHPSGVGVVFDSEAHQTVMRFVRELEIGLGLKPDDVLETVGSLSADTNISAGEAFLYSRLEAAPLTVAEARSAVSGLPFDFDEAVQSLMASELIRRSRNPTRPKSVRAPRRVEVRPASEADEEIPEPIEPAGLAAESSIALEKIQFSKEDADRILEIVEYFETQKNYMSAVETLKRALEHAPDEARFHHKVARLRAEFFADYAGSLRSARRAIRRDPENPEYRETLNYLEALQEAELMQPTIEIPMPGFHFRLIRHDPEIHRIWVEAIRAEGAPARKLVAVDTRLGKSISVSSADNPATMRVVPGNHPRLSAFDKRVPTAFKTLRERREKLLEMAQKASDYGPYYRVGLEPVAWCENSTFLIFDRDPRGGSSGLFLSRENRSSEPIRLDPDSRKSVSPAISHDEEKVAWVRVEPKPAICVSGTFGSGTDLCELAGEARLVWSDDSSHLFAVDFETSQLLRVDSETGEKEGIDLASDASVLAVAFDPLRKYAAIVLQGADATTLHGVELKQMRALDAIALPESSDFEICLREDGRVLVASKATLFLANLKTGKSREIVGPEAASMALERNRWQVDEPIAVVLDSQDAIEIIEVDPDAFAI